MPKKPQTVAQILRQLVKADRSINYVHRQTGVGLVSLRDAVDLDTPAGRLMSHVLASVAAYETEVRNERVRAGIAAARAAGKRWGGSKRGCRLSVTEEQVATIRRLARQGEKKTTIARTVGLSRGTIYRILRDAA